MQKEFCDDTLVAADRAAGARLQCADVAGLLGIA